MNHQKFGGSTARNGCRCAGVAKQTGARHKAPLAIPHRSSCHPAPKLGSLDFLECLGGKAPLPHSGRRSRLYTRMRALIVRCRAAGRSELKIIIAQRRRPEMGVSDHGTELPAYHGAIGQEALSSRFTSLWKAH